VKPLGLGIRSLPAIAVATLILGEVALRIWVPLSSMVDPNTLYPKVWYLDHVESLVARAEHPSHVSHPTLGWTYAANVRQGELSTNAGALRGRRTWMCAVNSSGLNRMCVVPLRNGFLS